mmetsp:Transcript_115453/g.313408  ORF Transcript_115453/g.313408 Transcript_115453/m.313408 type:complete len:324 (+) Transcript_115453:543-1514(+)
MMVTAIGTCANVGTCNKPVSITITNISGSTNGSSTSNTEEERIGGKPSTFTSATVTTKICRNARTHPISTKNTVSTRICSSSMSNSGSDRGISGFTNSSCSSNAVLGMISCQPSAMIRAFTNVSITTKICRNSRTTAISTNVISSTTICSSSTSNSGTGRNISSSTKGMCSTSAVLETISCKSSAKIGTLTDVIVPTKICRNISTRAISTSVSGSTTRICNGSSTSVRPTNVNVLKKMRKTSMRNTGTLSGSIRRRAPRNSKISNQLSRISASRKNCHLIGMATRSLSRTKHSASTSASVRVTTTLNPSTITARPWITLTVMP